MDLLPNGLEILGQAELCRLTTDRPAQHLKAHVGRRRFLRIDKGREWPLLGDVECANWGGPVRSPQVHYWRLSEGHALLPLHHDKLMTILGHLRYD